MSRKMITFFNIRGTRNTIEIDDDQRILVCSTVGVDTHKSEREMLIINTYYHGIDSKYIISEKTAEQLLLLPPDFKSVDLTDENSESYPFNSSIDEDKKEPRKTDSSVKKVTRETKTKSTKTTRKTTKKEK